MISKEIEKLVLQLIDDVRASESHKDQFREDPEACLALLLKTIREELPDVSAILKFSVFHALDDHKLKATRRWLDRCNERNKNSSKKKSVFVR